MWYVECYEHVVAIVLKTDIFHFMRMISSILKRFESVVMSLTLKPRWNIYFAFLNTLRVTNAKESLIVFPITLLLTIYFDWQSITFYVRRDFNMHTIKTLFVDSILNWDKFFLHFPIWMLDALCSSKLQICCHKCVKSSTLPHLF